MDFNIYRRDLSKLKLGQKVVIAAGDSEKRSESTISYISPFGLEGSQSMIARAELPNPDGDWKVGLFVTGEIFVEEATVPLAVKNSALQTFRDWDVVFLQDGTTFEIAILELGRRDHQWTEVLQGLSPGQRYVTENSFLIKADIGKFGASHDH